MEVSVFGSSQCLVLKRGLLHIVSSGNRVGVPVEIVEQILVPFFKNVLEHLKIWGSLEPAEQRSQKNGR